MSARPPRPARLAPFVLAAVAVCAPAAAAQDPGATAAAVLRVAPAPRALALGGAYAPLADPLSVFYNPARLSSADAAAAFAYRTLPVEAGVGTAALATRFGPGSLGFGAQFLNYGEVDVFEPDPSTGGEIGLPTGERVGGGELALSLGYAVHMPGGLQLGAAAKLLRLHLAEASATGTAFDFGMGLDLLKGRLALGTAVQNVGSDLGPARASPLPRQVRAGAALRLDAPAGLKAALAAEAVRRGDEIAPAIGLEIGAAGPGGASLVGRIGYDRSNGVEDRGAGRWPAHLVAGAGLNLDGLRLDYAHHSLGPLGSSHIFGLSLSLTRHE